MMQDFVAVNDDDSDGNPAGGYVNGVGLLIGWQDGPLGRGDARQEPNGAFVETVIAAAKQRIEYYQGAADGKFHCEENARAILHLDAALEVLASRTARREAAGIEGTHEEDTTG